MTTLQHDIEHLTDVEFNEISAYVKGLCGINLHEGKRELVKARLAKRVRQLKLASLQQYLRYVQADATGLELTAMLDSLSTNLTYFFREDDHFEYLRRVELPALAERNRSQARLRIWSAGCSSGEEPFSIAITLAEHFPLLPVWDVRILATDLSTRVLQRAGAATYGGDKLRHVPPALLSKHFEPLLTRAGERLHRVNSNVRSLVSLSRLNLMEPWPMRGPFDVIFCRNVMIYFDKPTQAKLVNRFWDILSPGGLLMVGHSESLSGVAHKFRYVQPATYRKA